MGLSYRRAVFDVLQNPLDSCGGKLGEKIVEAVRVQGESLPVNVAALMQPQSIRRQTVVAPGVAIAGEEKPM